MSSKNFSGHSKEAMKALFFYQYLKFKIVHCPANPDDLPCQTSFGGGVTPPPTHTPLKFRPCIPRTFSLFHYHIMLPYWDWITFGRSLN
jgi:hypothetical protein